MRELPLVSIICPTYNHEKFIANTIDGFLLQKTNFSIEIIVHDDASTDNTPKIIKDYEAKYPQLFSNIYQTENQYSKSSTSITNITFAEAKGNYIAFCEGDDYWCDENKLQKQVDFLEANPEYAICFHRVYEEINNKKVLSSDNPWNEEKSFDIYDLAKVNFMHTNSVVFKNGLIKNFPDWFKDSQVGDYVLHMLNAQHGLIKYFPQPMGVYRRFAGIWSGQSSEALLMRTIKVLDYLLLENFDSKVKQVLTKHKRELLNAYCGMLIDKGDFSYLDMMKKELEGESEFVKQWMLSYYPDKIKNIKDSKAYKLSQRLSKLKTSFNL